MSKSRKALNFILILIILSGIGFLVFNFGNMQGVNMQGMMNGIKNSSGNVEHGNMNMDGKEDNKSMSTIPNDVKLSTIATLNKDALSKVITTITDSINQITFDPYSKITLPGTVNDIPPTTKHQNSQGGTTININPNSTVNISPQANATPPQINGGTGKKYVYNQDKLEQLHNGIFKMSQGMMLLNSLNEDLTVQTNMPEPDNNQRYVNIYNISMQNKMKLNRALNLINEASVLINVNPYTASSGYEYNAAEMEQLHKGIYKLAQGLVEATKLSNDFTNQMTQASNLANNPTYMGNMNMNMGRFPRISNVTLTCIIAIILIVMSITLIIALIGAIKSIFTSKPRER